MTSNARGPDKIEISVVWDNRLKCKECLENKRLIFVFIFLIRIKNFKTSTDEISEKLC